MSYFIILNWENFHICLRLGPRELTPPSPRPPLTVSLISKETVFFDDKASKKEHKSPKQKTALVMLIALVLIPLMLVSTGADSSGTDKTIIVLCNHNFRRSEPRK